MYRLVLLFGLELALLDSQILASSLNESAAILFAERIQIQLRDTHQHNTAHSDLQESYSKVTIETSDFEDSHWTNILSKIDDHIANVSKEKKDELEEIVKIVNDTIKQYEKPKKFNYTTLERTVVIPELPTRRKEVNSYLRWYYDPPHEIGVFVPVVKIKSNESYDDVNWTEKAFAEVKKRNITQERYFIGTTHGILRFSPNQSWPTRYDTFDSRLQPWFLEAASSKHDVALLIDRSGSVERIMKRIVGFVKLIINLIPSHYCFNVFLFYEVEKEAKLEELKDCFGKSPLHANQNVKSALLEELITSQKLKPDNKSNLNDALENLANDFFNLDGREENKKMAIVFTDGKMDYDLDDLKRRVRDSNLKLLMLDFASPISPGRNKDLERAICDVGGYYVFVKDMGNWFEVVDTWFNATSARLVRSVDEVQDKLTRWSQPTVTYNSSSQTRKSIVLSRPVFKNDGTSRYLLKGVVGTDQFLDEFESNYTLDGGSLSYEIVALPNGKIINHPRLLSADIVPTLAQVEVKLNSSVGGAKVWEDVLYPLGYLTDAPITKIGLVPPYSPEKNPMSGAPNDNGVRYQLVVPKNDADNITIDISQLQETTSYTNFDEADRAKTFIRPFVNPMMNKKTVFACLNNLAECPEPLKPIANDLFITKKAFDKWQHKDTSLGNFLITRSGLLLSDVTNEAAYETAIAKKIPEYLEFSADPGKFQNETVLVTRPFGRPIHLSKSYKSSVSEEEYAEQPVLAVMGTRIKYTAFSDMVEEALEASGLDLDKDKWKPYLLDHKGYVLYPELPHGEGNTGFFGEIHGQVFEILVNEGFYKNWTFHDKICTRIFHQKSAGHRVSLFVVDFVGRLLSFTVSFLINTLLFVERTLSFSMSEPNIVKDCRRQIFAYERNFTASSDLIKGNYTCGNCSREYMALPIKDTNLLLVLVGKHDPPCNCTEVSYSRVGSALNDSLSYCDRQGSVPLTSLNKDLIYQEEKFENLTQEVCKMYEE